jgi:hypothetical protein
MELDAPPASPLVLGVGADPPAGTSSATATLAPLLPDPRLGHEKPLVLSWQQLGADRRHRS